MGKLDRFVLNVQDKTIVSDESVYRMACLRRDANLFKRISHKKLQEKFPGIARNIRFTNKTSYKSGPDG